MNGTEFILAVAAGVFASVLVGKSVYTKSINKSKKNNSNNNINQNGNNNNAYQNTTVNIDKQQKKGED